MNKKLFKTILLISIFLPILSYAASLELNGQLDIKNRAIKGFFTLKGDNETINFRKNNDIKILTEEKIHYNSKDDYSSIFLKKDKPVIVSFIKNYNENNDKFEEDYISFYSNILPEFLDNISANIHIKVNKDYELLLNGFSNIEARLADNQTKEYRITFTSLPKRLHLIASPLFKIYKTKLENGKHIYAYLFAEHENLATPLLKKATEYIKYYEDLLQIEYPYQNFSIIEDISPAGHAIEAMAVFGKGIIGRDFVLNRSLGHEILHQWVGCLVEADYSNGNWVEALTTYFADYNFEPNKIEYRKNILNELESYDEDELYPLEKFIGNYSKKDQLIGYGKGLLVINSAAKILGEENFLTKIIFFLKKYSNSKATFIDLLSALDMTDDFIKHNLKDSSLQKISFSNVNIENDNISFIIKRENGAKFENIFYTVKYTDQEKEYRSNIENNKMIKINIPDASKIESIFLDNMYNSIRKLDTAELIPAFYNILNSKSITFISDNYKNYKSFKNIAHNITSYIAPKKIYKTTIYDKDIIVEVNDIIPPNIASILGNDIVSKLQMGKSDAYITKNPHSNHNNYILFLHNFDSKLFTRLMHYRNYSYILFGNNGIEKQEKREGQNGILIYKK